MNNGQNPPQQKLRHLTISDDITGLGQVVGALRNLKHSIRPDEPRPEQVNKVTADNNTVSLFEFLEGASTRILTVKEGMLIEIDEIKKLIL